MRYTPTYTGILNVSSVTGDLNYSTSDGTLFLYGVITVDALNAGDTPTEFAISLPSPIASDAGIGNLAGTTRIGGTGRLVSFEDRVAVITTDPANNLRVKVQYRSPTVSATALSLLCAVEFPY